MGGFRACVMVMRDGRQMDIDMEVSGGKCSSTCQGAQYGGLEMPLVKGAAGSNRDRSVADRTKKMHFN